MIHETLSAEDYHADELGSTTPSLSKSIIQKLLTSSPAHAKAAHPRLTETPVTEEETHFDIGTVAHALLLEGDAAVEVLDYKDYRSNAAKDARDLARAADKTPLLLKHWVEVEAMVASTRKQLDYIGGSYFVGGKPEQTLVWQDHEVLCRARVDWLHDSLVTIDDYKTTSRSAAPEAWSKACFSIGADLQAAFYLRGLEACCGPMKTKPRFRFVVQETYAPYALAVYEMSPGVLDIADLKINHALHVWKKCLDTGVWPGYPIGVMTVEPTPWLESQWFEREEREAVA